MWPPARMPQSPMRYDGVLARSLPQLARLRIASFPTPYARIWAGTGNAQGTRLLRKKSAGTIARIAAFQPSPSRPKARVSPDRPKAQVVV